MNSTAFCSVRVSLQLIFRAYHVWNRVHNLHLYRSLHLYGVALTMYMRRLFDVSTV